MKNNQIPRSIKILNSFSKVSFWFTVGVSIIILFAIIYLLFGGSLEGDIKFGDNNYQNFNEVSFLSKLWLLIIAALALTPIILIAHFFSKFMSLIYNGKYFEIETITDIAVKPVVRRVNNEAWRGFVRGQEVTLIMNDATNAGGSTFLLACILRHYFGLHVGINSFVEVVLKNDHRQKDIMRWKPLPGTQISL